MDYIAYDQLPVVGKSYLDSKNMFVISGFKKWGLTTSMVAANIIPDLLAGKPPARRVNYFIRIAQAHRRLYHVLPSIT